MQKNVNEMEIKSEYYAPNASRPVGDIITASLEGVVDELVVRAGYNMDASLGSDADHRRLVSLIVGVLKRDFRFLPLYRVAEGFYRGSLGELGGTTKLTVRNAIIWIREIDSRHRQSKTESDRLVKDNEPKEKTCPYGATAILLKWNWRKKNLISAEDWDRYPIKHIIQLLTSGRPADSIKPEEVRV